MSRVNIKEQQPQAYEAMFGLEQYLADTKVAPDLRELVRIRASLINQCQFCIGMHSEAAKKLGVSDEKINALYDWEANKLFDDKEQAALSVTDAVTNISAEGLPNDIYENAEKFFSDDELAQLIVLISTINAWNRIGVSTARHQ